MDKETLSNYGWIVICVLVLAVMIALATPFGSYISGAVKSTTAGLFETNRSALNSTGLIDIDGQQFDGDPIVRSGKILKSAKYTAKATGTVLEGNGTNTLPDTPVTGDTYEEGDYKYTYNSKGWSVVVKDTSKTSYGEILSEIAGKPVTSMYGTFAGCSNLTTAPVIPNSVTDMFCTFSSCTSLTTAPDMSKANNVTNMDNTFANCNSLTAAPEIPNSVTDMSSTFSSCSSLTIAPVIPNSVTDMTYTFDSCTSLTTAPKIPNSVTNLEGTFGNCTSLTTAPEIPNSVTDMLFTFANCSNLTTAPQIPNSVTNMVGTFQNCTSLTGTVEINANPKTYDCCFSNTKESITLTGTSEFLALLAATNTNGNVTVQQ